MASKTAVTLEQTYQFYDLSLSYEGKRPKTIGVYLAVLRRFLAYLKERSETPLVKDLNTETVMEYIAHLKKVGKFEHHPFCPRDTSAQLSPMTIDQHVRTLKGFATWLMEKGYTKQNVLKDLARPKLPKLTIETLTDEEIQKILASINTKTFLGARNYAIILVLLDTGLRCGELCGLTLDTVQMSSKHCYVKVMGKGQKERIVYLGRRAHEAMLNYLTFVRPHYANMDSGQAFFLTDDGTPISLGAVQLALRCIAQKTGIERLHAHLLRHTAATRYLVAGGDVISLQQKLGHAGLEMTNRYVHLAGRELAAIQERVAPMDRLDIKPMRVPKER